MLVVHRRAQMKVAHYTRIGVQLHTKAWVRVVCMKAEVQQVYM